MFSSSFSRLFGHLVQQPVGSTPSNSSTPAAAQPNAAPPAPAKPIVVGQGSVNERHVTIAGIPMLFRDEGDVVVQFKPDFDYDLRETPVGTKLIPALVPHWSMCAEHKLSLTLAIAKAIKAGGHVVLPAQSHVSTTQTPESPQSSETVSEPADQEAPLAPTANRRTERANYGRIKEWGEKKFPDGKRPGKFYESFCLTLTNRGEDRVLQGEGLRDAIADVGCQIGESVEVRRLGKIKVPAVDKKGRPKYDAAGNQLLWDKWQWSIKRKS